MHRSSTGARLQQTGQKPIAHIQSENLPNNWQFSLLTSGRSSFKAMCCVTSLPHPCNPTSHFRNLEDVEQNFKTHMRQSCARRRDLKALMDNPADAIHVLEGNGRNPQKHVCDWAAVFGKWLHQVRSSDRILQDDGRQETRRRRKATCRQSWRHVQADVGEQIQINYSCVVKHHCETTGLQFDSFMSPHTVHLICSFKLHPK